MVYMRLFNLRFTSIKNYHRYILFTCQLSPQNVPLEDEAVLERAELSEQHKNPFLSCSLQLLVFAVW